MKVNLTEESAEILLEQEEVRTLVKGEVVMGTPDTAFLSPFGMRVLLVRPVQPKRCEGNEQAG